MSWQDANAGGFETTTVGFQSPGGAGRSNEIKEYGTGVKPVSLNTIVRSHTEEGFVAPDGSNLSWVTVIARIVNIQPSDMRTDYLLDDLSGSTLNCKQFYQEDDESEARSACEVGQWVRIVGGCKSFKGEPHLNASNLQVIKDPDQITTQLIEMMHSYLLSNQKVGAGAADGVSLTGDSVADQVHRVIQQDKNQTGMGVDSMRSALPHLSEKDLRGVLDRLSGDGFIFSTIDEDHFRSTQID